MAVFDSWTDELSLWSRRNRGELNVPNRKKPGVHRQAATPPFLDVTRATLSFPFHQIEQIWSVQSVQSYVPMNPLLVELGRDRKSYGKPWRCSKSHWACSYQPFVSRFLVLINVQLQHTSQLSKFSLENIPTQLLTCHLNISQLGTRMKLGTGGRRMLQNWNAPAPTAKFTWKPVPLNSADFEISTAGRKKGQKEQRDRFLIFFTRIDPVADPGRMSADSLDMIGFKPLTNRIQSIYILKRTLSNFEHDRIWDVHRLSGFHKIQDDPPLCFFYITDNRCALFCIMDLPPHWGHATLSATSKHWPQAPNPLQLEQMTLELHMLHIMLHIWAHMVQ